MVLCADSTTRAPGPTARKTRPAIARWTEPMPPVASPSSSSVRRASAPDSLGRRRSTEVVMDPCNHAGRRRLTSGTVAESDDEQQRFARRVAAFVQRVDRSPTLLAAARRARELLPGDAEFGDSL